MFLLLCMYDLLMSSPDPAAGVVSVDDSEIVGADPWLKTRLDHPEDLVVFDERTLFAGGESGQLYRIDVAEGTVSTVASTDGFALGLELGPNGDLYACDFQNHAIFRLPLTDDGMPTGSLKTEVQGSHSNPPRHPNYCLFDSDGRLYLSDSGDRENMAASGGCIYVVNPDGTGRVLTDGPSAFPNGLALSQDEQILYVAESGTHEVSALHLDDGRVVDTEFVTNEFGFVDGLALNADDDLYAASIGDNAVYRLVDGEVELVVADPDGLVIGNPTNIAFGGPEMRTLYVANLGLWHLTAIELDDRGRHPTIRS